MSIRDRIMGKPGAVAEHRAARAELDAVAKRDREETPEFLAANSRVAAT